MKKYLNILSVFLIVLVCFLTLTGCKSGVKVKDDGGDMLIQTTEERGIHLSRRNAKNDDGSYTITATVTPADATNKKLTWTLDCDDENFSDAYDIENYVQLTVSSDTLSCDVLKLASCPVQLKIVVTSQQNSSVSATCTIDFYKLSTGYEDLIIYYDADEDDPDNELVELEIIDGYIDLSSYSFGISSGLSFLEYRNILSYGTINTNNELQIYINWSDEILNQCIDETSNAFTNSEESVYDDYDYFVNLYEYITNNADCNDIQSLDTILSKTDILFQIRLEIIDRDFDTDDVINIFEYEFGIKGVYDLSMLTSTSVTSVDLDESNIIL